MIPVVMEELVRRLVADRLGALTEPLGLICNESRRLLNRLTLDPARRAAGFPSGYGSTRPGEGVVEEGIEAVAQKVVRELADDLDGSPAATTVRFGYDGRNYEIDLSEAHVIELEEFLAPYREHARRVGGGGRGGRDPRPPRQDTEAIRRWARDHGYQVSNRGRLPTDVVAAYQATHGQAR